jgi:hypothetical protein
MQEAQRAAPATAVATDGVGLDEVASASRLVRSSLEACDTPPSRARAALELLVRTTHSSGGLLYAITSEGPVLQAECGGLVDSPAITNFVSECLAAEQSAEHTTMATTEAQTTAASTMSLSSRTVGVDLRPLLLNHDDAGGRSIATAVVVLLCSGAPQYPGALIGELSRALVRETHG